MRSLKRKYTLFMSNANDLVAYEELHSPSKERWENEGGW